MRAEEDDAPEAARDWLAELQELLLTGGYFRARIASLAPFDKARRPPRTRRRGRGAPRRGSRPRHAAAAHRRALRLVPSRPPRHMVFSPNTAALLSLLSPWCR